MAQHISSDEREKPNTKNTLPGRLSFRYDGEIKIFYRQAKAKRVQHHKTSFTRNVKGSSLSEIKKATTRNMTITKEKLIRKDKYAVKEVNQPYIKIVGRLKDKSSKIISIHNKQLRDTQNK